MKGKGKCFEQSLHLLLFGDGDGGSFLELIEGGRDEARLVHGAVTHPEALIRHVHAWVQVGNIVLDFSNGHGAIIPAERYYAIGEIVPEEMEFYTREEARENLIEHGHYGPWSEKLGGQK